MRYFGPVFFVDAAWDLRGYRVGGLIPGKGVQSWRPTATVIPQQKTELEGMAWVVRLAAALGWKVVNIFADSTAGGSQTVAVGAKP